MKRWLYIIRHWNQLERVAAKLFDLVDEHGGFMNSAGSFNPEQWEIDSEIKEHWLKFLELRERFYELDVRAR